MLVLDTLPITDKDLSYMKNLHELEELCTHCRAEGLEDADVHLIMNGARAVLNRGRKTLSGSAVLEDRYGVNFSVMAVPKGHAAQLSYINDFIHDATASGLVRSTDISALSSFTVELSSIGR